MLEHPYSIKLVSRDIEYSNEQEYWFSVSKNKHKIGRLCTNHYYHRYGRFCKKVFMTHSSLNKKYHDIGLGIAMYSFAFNFLLSMGHVVRSDYSYSPFAQRVWESKAMNNLFEIKKRKQKDRYGSNSPYVFYATNVK